MTDLPNLAKEYAALPAPPWVVKSRRVLAGTEQRYAVVTANGKMIAGEYRSEEVATALCAFGNSIPAMLAVIAAAQEVVDEDELLDAEGDDMNTSLPILKLKAALSRLPKRSVE